MFIAETDCGAPPVVDDGHPLYLTGWVVREAKEADFEVASMDNEAAFGPVFLRPGFAEAIKGDLLTDYQVVVVGVDEATYRLGAAGRFVTMDGTEVTDARTPAGQIAGQGDAPLRPAPHHHLPLTSQTCTRVRPVATRGDRLDARAPAPHGTLVV